MDDRVVLLVFITRIVSFHQAFHLSLSVAVWTTRKARVAWAFQGSGNEGAGAENSDEDAKPYLGVECNLLLV